MRSTAATWKRSGKRSGVCACAAPRRSASPPPTASCLGLQQAARRTKRPSCSGWTKSSATWPAAVPPPSICSGPWIACGRRPTRLRAAVAAATCAERCWPRPGRSTTKTGRCAGRIGRHGAELLPDGQGVLTHCNAGGLATADYGTALAVIFTAHDQGKRLHVYVDETRPLLQGARLTAWELQQRGIPTTLICDSMAAQVMREGRVQAVITGADRIAANGDTANKIGTYGVALLAAAHEIPFYVAAPSSTFDLSLASGDQIPDRAAGRRGDHARLRPADRTRGRVGLQSGFRRHACATYPRHRHRVWADPARVGRANSRSLRPGSSSHTRRLNHGKSWRGRLRHDGTDSSGCLPQARRCPDRRDLRQRSATVCRARCRPQAMSRDKHSPPSPN